MPLGRFEQLVKNSRVLWPEEAGLCYLAKAISSKYLRSAHSLVGHFDKQNLRDLIECRSRIHLVIVSQYRMALEEESVELVSGECLGRVSDLFNSFSIPKLVSPRNVADLDASTWCTCDKAGKHRLLLVVHDQELSPNCSCVGFALQIVAGDDWH